MNFFPAPTQTVHQVQCELSINSPDQGVGQIVQTTRGPHAASCQRVPEIIDELYELSCPPTHPQPHHRTRLGLASEDWWPLEQPPLRPQLAHGCSAVRGTRLMLGIQQVPLVPQ